MACSITKEFIVTLADGDQFRICSDRDLSCLDSTLRYCKSIEPTGRFGLGLDDKSTHDGKPLDQKIDRERGRRVPQQHLALPRVTKDMSLGEVDAVLRAHREQRPRG